MPMLGKPAAIGYTFLWSIAYGFLISIVLTVIFMLALPENENSPDSLKNAGAIILVATLAATIAQIWLVFGTCYGYGLTDCPEAVKLRDTKPDTLYY